MKLYCDWNSQYGPLSESVLLARYVYTYEEFVIVTEAPQNDRVLLKSTIISIVLSVLSSSLLRLHQTASSLTSCLYHVSIIVIQ